MTTDSRLKVKMICSLAVLAVCLVLSIAAPSGAQPIDVRVSISRTAASAITEVTVSATGFGMRETLTISVDAASGNPFPDKRYHDWLNVNQCNVINTAFSGG
jgi:hypothetical protein